MLVYGLQKQQCEKHFRRIHPSLNVVVSRSPFLPLSPHTVLGNCTSTKSRKKERTFIFHFSIIIITDPEETNSKAAEKEPVLHSHSLTQSSRDPIVGARSQKGKLHRLFGRAVVPLYTHYLLFALLRIPFTNIFVPSASNRPSSVVVEEGSSSTA